MLGLGVDESYMVVAGRGPLQLGYFDHPLVSWWMARGIADLAGSEAAWLVRLPFILLFAFSTWAMARLGTALFSARAGLWAAVSMNLAPVFGVTSGGWVLPDGPLVAALLGAVLFLVHALERRGWQWWLGAGACAGLAMLSKYTAVLALGGAVLYLLSQPRHRSWLVRPQPYVAGLVALAVFSPAIIWNAEHGWASLAFQGGRAAAARLHLLGPLVTLGGEALFLLPWIWAGLALVFEQGLRAGRDAWRSWLLVCLAAPPILLFLIVSLWSRQVLFHWAVPGYLMLFPLLGAWLAERSWAPRALTWTAGFVAIALIAGVGVVRNDLLPGDPLLQLHDWTELRGQLAARHLLDRPIAASSWSDAGKIGIGLGPDIPLYCLNVDAREFRFSTTPPNQGDLLIIAPGRSPAQMQVAYGGLFESIEPLAPLRVSRTDIPVYIGHGLRHWP